MMRLTIVLAVFFLFSCKKKEEDTPLSNQVQLLSLTFEYEGSQFNTSISGTEVSLTRALPSEAKNLIISHIQISDGASANASKGDTFLVDNTTKTITITAESGENSRDYTISLEAPVYTSIVNQHGLLQVQSNHIVDKNGEPVSLAGNSFFWSNNNWGGERYYTPEVVNWLRIDWNTTIIRAAMGVEDPGGYIDDPETNKNRLKTLVDAAIAEGMYVIIDWHSHHAEEHEAEAIAFFKEMATLYGNYDNIIYEIYNEPLDISWNNIIKPYAENVITAIRAIDADNIIVVGTPNWSQDVDQPAANPITISSNIAYTLHFYTVYHQQALSDKATAALNSGIAIIATEWGSVGYTQNDPETDLWMDWCKTNHISHCNWSVNDKVEEWSILKQGASTTGNWNESNITEAGKLAKQIITQW